MDPVRLFEDGTALISMRNSDFDAYSALGEVIDNSIQADSKNVKIKFEYEAGQRKNSYAAVKRVVFGDDGTGMGPEVIHRCLQLGYSTRYNDRSGIGRFGVGATLAAINQCRRVEIYSREKNKDWLFTYIDLDDISSKKMIAIPAPEKKDPPKDIKELTGNISGTLVIWSKYDRQPVTAYEMVEEARYWIGRTYRKFIWKDINIEFNEEKVKAIDPLYVTTEKTLFPNDPPAYEYEPIRFSWPVGSVDKPKGGPDDSQIEIRMSLIDEKFRQYIGAGNSKDARDRYIDRNEGVSILRNDREVFYGPIPHFGKEFEDIDRWWGCEVSFRADLDRVFTVKNIKRGAVPNTELKKTIHDKITPTRKTAIETVQELWRQNDAKKMQQIIGVQGEVLVTGHEEAEQVAADTPTDKSEIDKNKNVNTEAQKLVGEIKKEESKEKQAGWVVRFTSQPFNIVDNDWKGPHFMEVNHLGGHDVIVYNLRHPFIKTLYEIIDSLKGGECDPIKAQNLKCLIDILVIAYSKAEAKFDNNLRWENLETFLENLRLNWGQYLSSYIETWKSEQK